MQEDENGVDASWPRLLVERISEYAIFRLSADGEVASWNPGTRRIKGYEADEIIGRHEQVRRNSTGRIPFDRFNDVAIVLRTGKRRDSGCG